MIAFAFLCFFDHWSISIIAQCEEGASVAIFSMTIYMDGVESSSTFGVNEIRTRRIALTADELKMQGRNRRRK